MGTVQFLRNPTRVKRCVLAYISYQSEHEVTTGKSHIATTKEFTIDPIDNGQKVASDSATVVLDAGFEAFSGASQGIMLSSAVTSQVDSRRLETSVTEHL